VTAMATAGPQWAVVMSRNAGFQAQCVELDFQYSSEGIHRRWDEGAPCCPACKPRRDLQGRRELASRHDEGAGLRLCYRLTSSRARHRGAAGSHQCQRSSLRKQPSTSFGRHAGCEPSRHAHVVICRDPTHPCACRRLPYHVLCGDGGPVSVHPQHPTAPAGGRGAGDAAHFQLPLPPRQGERGRRNFILFFMQFKRPGVLERIVDASHCIANADVRRIDVLGTLCPVRSTSAEPASMTQQASR